MKIKFNDGTGTKFGTPIGNYMAILSENNGYVIYKIVPSTLGRGKLINCIFATIEDAKWYGQEVDINFRLYLPIWDVNGMGNVDPIAWAKWHSQEHLTEYVVFSMLNLLHLANNYPTPKFTNFLAIDNEYDAVMVCLKHFLLRNKVNMVTKPLVEFLRVSEETKKLTSWWSRNKNWDHQVKGALGVM